MKGMVGCLITATIIITGVSMALLVGFVLPPRFLDEEVISPEGKWQEYWWKSAGENRKPPRIKPYLRQRNAERKYGKIINFSWLVSLSLSRYLDARSVRRYACTGVVISGNRVLTGNDCIPYPFTEGDLFRGLLRSESAHYYRGGAQHFVTGVWSSKDKLLPPYDAFYILEVTPPFSVDVEILQIAEGSSKNNWEVAIEAGWGGTKVAYRDILKHEPFYYEEWHQSEDLCCHALKRCSDIKKVSGEACKTKAVLQGYPKQSTINGRALVTTTNNITTLIGMQMNYEYKNDITTFVDVSYEEFLKWIDSPTIEYKNKAPNMSTLYVYRKINSSFYFIEEKYEPERSIFKKTKSERVVTAGVATHFYGDTENNYDDNIWNIWMGVGKKSESERETNTTENDSVSDPVSEKIETESRSENKAKSEISHGGRYSRSVHPFGTRKIDSIRGKIGKKKENGTFSRVSSSFGITVTNTIIIENSSKNHIPNETEEMYLIKASCEQDKERKRKENTSISSPVEIRETIKENYQENFPILESIPRSRPQENENVDEIELRIEDENRDKAHPGIEDDFHIGLSRTNIMEIIPK
ncbi:hypothetical protein JTB14_020423 [Gonioctena quinquepunctata]|nr:hypothetical protein JTB14_020423 [Gonioctena quinquepunctata]